MADTPAEKPKRRRAASKSSAAAPTPAPKQVAPKRPRGRAAAATTETSKAAPAPTVEAPAAAPTEAKPKAARKQKAPVVERSEAKPTAPRKVRAASKPRAAAKPAIATPARAPRKSAAATPVVAAPAAARAQKPQVKPATDVSPEVPRAGLFAALGTLAAVGGAFYLWRSSKAEEPDYEVLESDGIIEIRQYPSLVTAGTEHRGQRRRALNDGFRVLADYIFAKSRDGAKLPMTAPVLCDSDGGGSWRTRFIMPTGKARAELPNPPSGVELTSEPSRRVATLRFSGKADDATLESKENALRSWLQMRSYPSEGRAVHAFYNAPFLPGPLRRNEVMIILSEEGGMG